MCHGRQVEYTLYERSAVISGIPKNAGSRCARTSFLRLQRTGDRDFIDALILPEHLKRVILRVGKRTDVHAARHCDHRMLLGHFQNFAQPAIFKQMYLLTGRERQHTPHIVTKGSEIRQ
jgi:hypothetical protein